MNRAHLIEEIEDVFSGISRPEDKYIVPSGGDDLWVASFLGSCESTWNEIDASKIEYEYAELTCVKPEAYAYYLAAYMVWCLKNYDKSDSNTIDHTIYNLNCSNCGPTSRSRLIEKYEAMSESQSRVVLNYLNFMANLPEFVDSKAAHAAIQSYWCKFESR